MKHRLARSIVVALALLATPATAQTPIPETAYRACLDAASDNMTWAGCGATWVKAERTLLDAVVQELDTLAPSAFTSLSTEEWAELKSGIMEEQRAWQAYNEKACGWMHNPSLGREAQVLAYPSCKASELRRRRIELEGVVEFLRDR